jgi:transcriptional regulator with XRE-family HTH domain
MEQNTKRLVGPRLKAIAAEKAISQVELAKSVGISRIALNRFFRGHSEVRASDLVKILEVLGHPLTIWAPSEAAST